MDEKPTKLEFTDKEFGYVRSTAETFYRSIGSVHCPYFNEKINFNTEGIEHLKFKTWNRARERNDQFMRLKLIKLAPEVIRRSRTLQGIWQTKLPVRRKRHGVWEKVFTDVTYYEFIAVLEQKRVKVIVKQFLGGEKFFWTMIPYWRMNQFNKRVLHDGNLEMD